MVEKLKIVFRFLKFYLTAKNRYKIHSPFVYSILTETLSPKKETVDENVVNLEMNIQKLFKNPKRIDYIDVGERSRFSSIKTIGKKAKSISQSAKTGRILYRIAMRFKPEVIIELGTGAGVGSAYLAEGSKISIVNTIEGNPVMYNLAQHFFSSIHSENISLYHGLFADVLPDMVRNQKNIDMVFIDGDHKRKALLQYFSILKPHLREESVVVIHDIYWSSDMLSAWNELKRDEIFSVSIDIFHLGILFCNKKYGKASYKLRV